jgi:hypothetical protein
MNDVVFVSSPDCIYSYGRCLTRKSDRFNNRVNLTGNENTVIDII